MVLKPWYKVVTPREDLRNGQPLDAAEFAVHLDKVREGTAPADYCNPERFFDRTFLTNSLYELSSQVVRRLSGITTETSAIFNMATQFGGGKTHALTLLYHLLKGGKKANSWRDVPKILDKAKIQTIPDHCAIGIFIGTEFDSLRGRGGNDGTPLRKTPWGELAFQIGGKESFEFVSQHDREFVEPKGDVIREFLPKNRPCLILMDEIINYVSTYRHLGYHNKLYNFIQVLSEVARGADNVTLVVSIPASELSYTDKDETDQQRFKNMLDRVGKAIMMSEDFEISEIIRRRLFEWDPKAVGQDGRVLLPQDAIITCKGYADWISDNRHQIPSWFPLNPKDAFEASYPFHPMVLSVFERKWQELPRFQQTRGVLRLLALWVSHAYLKGFKKNQNEPLIGLGTAPLDDSIFRSAVFEQLGESKLEGALTTDITGKKDSHAIRLDQEAEETLKNAQIHKKVSTAIFFESNGGQTNNFATVPEIRLDVAEPDLDIGNIETALEALTDSCFYLNVERNQYRFSLKENLNKRYADRRACVKREDVEKLVLEEIQKVFPATEGIERVFFPEKSNQIPDRPVITFIVMSPNQSIQEDSTINIKIDTLTKEYGTSSRTYKSALIWLIPATATNLWDEARRLIAWTDIENEGLKLDDAQERQLEENIKKSKRDLRENIWRTYNKIMLLGRDNAIRTLDLGIVTTGAAETMCRFVLNYLRQTDDIAKEVSPRTIIKNWPPAFIEWNTKFVRDSFYASPQFPRLLNSESIKDTIARGAAEGLLAYVGKSPQGGYSPFYYRKPLNPSEVEISEDMFIIQAEEAEKHIKPPELKQIIVSPSQIIIQPGKKQALTVKGLDQFGRDFLITNLEWTVTGGVIDKDGVFKAGQDEGNFIVTVRSGNNFKEVSVLIGKETDKQMIPDAHEKNVRLSWAGIVPAEKWMNFYTKVLSPFIKGGNIKIKVAFDASPEEGLSEQRIEQVKIALKDLGMDEKIDLK